MHTPEQASELWCPMVRIARHEYINMMPNPDHIIGGCNTDALSSIRVPASCRCIADQCAMWRWGEPVHRACHQPTDQKDGYAEQEPPRPPSVPASWVWEPADIDPGAWVEPQAEAEARRRGYCGLASIIGATP